MLRSGQRKQRLLRDFPVHTKDLSDSESKSEMCFCEKPDSHYRFFPLLIISLL